MLLRAALVLLLVINLGVAAWWATRAPAPPAPAVIEPAGVPRLQLLAEVAAPPRAVVAALPVTPARCLSFGPYPTPAALRRAHERLQPQVLRAQARAATTGTPSGWQVWLPPQADRAQAQALAARIQAAGFDDLFIVAEGSEAHAIALGRYRDEPTAQRRQAALQAAGFDARRQPLGEVGSEWWLDVAVGADFDAVRAAQDSAAASTPALDCAQLP